MGRIILNRIKQIRWDLGLTVQDVADRSGLSKGAVSKLENGRTIPNQITIMMISKGLGLPAQDIFTFDYNDVDLLYKKN